MIVGRRHAVLWEAGANPALPRNCMRGQRKRSLGITTWEGRLQQPDAGPKLIGSSRPDSQSQETGVNRPHNPFA